VGMADSIQSDYFSMALAAFSPETKGTITEVLKAKGLDALVSLSNPLDINPSADDQAHAGITEILTRDPGVDAVILSLDPMSPAMKTLENPNDDGFNMNRPEAILPSLVALCRRSRTPVVAVVDGGRLYDPLRDALMAGGVPVFTVCDKAVAALSMYIQGRLRADAVRTGRGLEIKEDCCG